MSNLPGWVGPTVAIALVVIALGFMGLALAALALTRRATNEARAMSRELAELRQELGPTIQAINQWADSGGLGGKLRDEVNALLAVSRDLRARVVRGAGRVERRLDDLDALYEVVSDEVEDTALDLASKLRAFRTGTSALSRIKRLLVRGRR